MTTAKQKLTSIAALGLATVAVGALMSAPAVAASSQREIVRHSHVTLRPVRNSAGCRTLLAAHPNLSTVAKLRAFGTSGPCAPAASAGARSARMASPAALGTISCSADGLGTIIEPFISPLQFFESTMFMIGCSGPAGTPLVECNAANVAVGAPAPSAGVAEGSGGCDALTLPVTTIGGTAVIAGIGFAVDLSGDIATSGLLFGLAPA